MSTTQPIRDKELLKKFKNYYKETKTNYRNNTIIIIGLNTALRINDILNLTYHDVFHNGKVREHLIIKEKKTGKINQLFLNNEVRLTLQIYFKNLKETTMYKKGNPYLFPSPRTENAPLSRYQAYRIICAAAKAAGIEGHISCHSLRKTFGYLCIDQDDKDAVFRDIII